MKQLAAATNEIFILPPSPHDPYPPLPIEVDDEYIHAEYVQQQPSDVTSVITGFNFNIKIFLSYDSLEAINLAHSFGVIKDREEQKKALHQSLHACKSVLETLPKELVVIPVTNQAGGSANASKLPSGSAVAVQDPAQINSSEQETLTESRRKVQYEIQKANIYASHLGTRSYIVEKYWNMFSSQKKASDKATEQEGLTDDVEMGSKDISSNAHDLTEEEISFERDSIVKDLLLVLSSISQVSMEPNADSLVRVSLLS